MLERLRAWARKYTENARYSPVGQIFHWTMAALVMFQLGWGFYTDWLFPGGEKVRAYQVHSAAGLPILILALLRGGWRILIPGPHNDADEQGWQTKAAYVVEYLFYVSFFALPLSGWVMWSAIAPQGPLYVAGILPWPPLPLETLPITARISVLQFAESVHHFFVILLLVLIPAHVGAAVKHHFWDRHDVLRGMLPEIPDREDPRATTQHKSRDRRLPGGSEVG